MHTQNTKHSAICARCGKHFPIRFPSSARKYCGSECRYAATSEHLSRPDLAKSATCHKCGGEFTYPRHRGERKYCGRKCSDAANKNPHDAEWVERTCLSCGKAFSVQSWKGREHVKTCSRSCGAQYRARTVVGKNHPLYKPKKPMRCEQCGKVCMVKPSLVSRFRFCSRRCTGSHNSQNQPKVSSLETTMAAMFTSAGIAFAHQFSIGQYVVDFAFPDSRLVVECDGTYWHSLPGKPAKDRQKTGYLKSRGWTVVRLPEADIRKSPEQCLERVLHAIALQESHTTASARSSAPISDSV